MAQRLVDRPADRDDQEEREGAERREPPVRQDPPRRQVHEPERQDEHRVLHQREREQPGADETEGPPHEPVVERRLPRLVSPLETLGEHRLPRVIRGEGRGEPEPEEDVETGPHEEQAQRPPRRPEPRPARPGRRGECRGPRRHGPGLVDGFAGDKSGWPLRRGEPPGPEQAEGHGDHEDEGECCIEARGERSADAAGEKPDPQASEGLGADAGGEDSHDAPVSVLGRGEEDDGALHRSESGIGGSDGELKCERKGVPRRPREGEQKQRAGQRATREEPSPADRVASGPDDRRGDEGAEPLRRDQESQGHGPHVEDVAGEDRQHLLIGEDEGVHEDGDREHAQDGRVRASLAQPRQEAVHDRLPRRARRAGTTRRARRRLAVRAPSERALKTR